MNTEELKAAAERMRQMAYSVCAEDMYQYLNDCMRVAHATLPLIEQAERENDQTPVTEDWLLSIGGYKIPLFGEGRPGIALKVIVAIRHVVIAFYVNPLLGNLEDWAIIDTDGKNMWLPSGLRKPSHNNVIYRGQVRKLLSALGCEVKEKK